MASPLLSATSPMFYTSAVDFDTRNLLVRLPVAGVGQQLAGAGMRPAPGTATPVSATTVAKALSVVQASPVAR